MSAFQYPKISDQIYEVLFNRIINQELKPGERLIEKGLANELGASRTPLRDAITRLAKEGFVEIRPREGAYIKDFQIEDVMEIYDIRKYLESLAVSLAASRIKEKDLKRLKNLFLKKDRKILIKADTEFHNLIIRSSGNKKLIELLDNIYNFIQIFRLRGYYSKEKSKKATSDHIRILDALIKGDGVLAEELMRQHIEKTKQDILVNHKQLQIKEGEKWN